MVEFQNLPDEHHEADLQGGLLERLKALPVELDRDARTPQANPAKPSATSQGGSEPPRCKSVAEHMDEICVRSVVRAARSAP